MSPTQRQHPTAVIQRLLQAPQQFDFFQSARLLDRWLDKGASGGRGLQRVSFRNSLSLSFPASEIEAVSVHLHGEEGAAQDLPLLIRPSDIRRIDITPAFMGLLGVTGTMPFYYTEILAQRELYQKDFGARAFMDIFSHRAVTLFYDAWRKHRLPLRYEADRSDTFVPLTLSLIGMAGAGQPGRGQKPAKTRAVSPEAFAYFGGAVQQRAWSAKQVEALLKEYFQIPVRIEQFVGRWYPLPEAGKAYLGLLGRAGGMASGVLGRSAILGARVWQRDRCLRVVLGPITREKLQRFLPGSRGAQALQEWLSLCCGGGLSFEINLQLQHDHVRPTVLDSRRPAHTACLGWDTFLQTRTPSQDRVDVRYELQAVC